MPSTTDRGAPHARPALERYVDVWLADPADFAEAQSAAQLQASLSPLEAQRRAGFRRAADRHLYGIAHGLLRHILSDYIACDPASWRFARGERGRPEIAGPPAGNGLRFSLSHTNGCIAIIVTSAWACGIDVEAARALEPNWLATSLLTPTEQSWFRRLTDDASRRDALLTVWTVKEALLKAAGLGIVNDLQNVELGPGWPRPRCLQRRTAVPAHNTAISLQHYRLGSSHWLSLAVHGPLAQADENASNGTREVRIFRISGRGRVAFDPHMQPLWQLPVLPAARPAAGWRGG